MLGLEGTLVIVDIRLMAASLRHGYATKSTVATPYLLLNGTGVPIVIVCKLVWCDQPGN